MVVHPSSTAATPGWEEAEPWPLPAAHPSELQQLQMREGQGRLSLRDTYTFNPHLPQVPLSEQEG